eukprot:Opistho-1_new@93391
MAENKTSEPTSDDEEFHDAEENIERSGATSELDDVPSTSRPEGATDDDDDEEMDPTLASRAAESVRTGVDAEGLPAGLGLTPEEIRKGFGLFFENKQPEAEKFFEQFKESVPVFALGYAALQVMRAVMTFEQQDMERAMRCLRETEALANAASLNEGRLQQWARYMVGRKQEKTSEKIHNTIMCGESRLLVGVLQFFSESIIQFIKGGLNIRAAWKIYERMFSIYEKNQVELDRETRGAIQFGIGLFNLINSIMPAKILKLISVLGFPASRDRALQELNLCHQGGGVRAPIASLILLAYHVVLQSFFSYDSASHAAKAEKILAESFERFPGGGLFLLMSGRLQRVKRNIPASVVEFEKAAESQPAWKQFQHLCCYELGWCHFFVMSWERALPYLERLVLENEWSKGFYTYMMAMCYWEMNQRDKAVELLNRVPDLLKRKWGGKTLSVEQFVLRKYKTYVADRDAKDCALFLPAHEIIYLWNGFTQMSSDLLTRCLGEVTAYEQANPDHADDPNREAVVRLMKGSLLKELGNFEAARGAFAWIEENRKHISEENYVIPHARYEQTVICLHEEKQAEAAEWLERAQSYSEDYNFEVRLRMRMHLTSDHITV